TEARPGDAADGDPAPAPLPGLARQLLAHGVPAVVAMQSSVSDRYATAFGALMYRALATMERPDPLTALCEARRNIEAARCRDDDRVDPILAEWATPVLLLSCPSLPLYDPAAPMATVAQQAEPRLAEGVVVRRVGDFVGRRREQRLILAALDDAQGAGVLIRGLGGVGKSTLAAQIVHELAAQDWLVVSRVG
ncbi:MAG: AAA family ATPase, partial [Delftia sp.]|nr:AAA family ATPase [Delftia sp.]